MFHKEKVLISACLIGENVKYNGKNNLLDDIEELKKRYDLVPFCPEVEGGLPTPRPPSEIVCFEPLKLVNQKGEDVTECFVNGAKKCLEVCKSLDVEKAILKSNSPSCGKNRVYDGTFSGKLVALPGVTAKLLKENNIKVFDEKDMLIFTQTRLQFIQ